MWVFGDTGGRRARLISHDWTDGRWWRVIACAQTWCETSDEEEARQALADCPYPKARLEHHQHCTTERWVEVK